MDRLKAKARHGGEKERFARLTASLLESPAICTLPHPAFKVLTILALGARPGRSGDRKDKGRNGIQAVTASFAKRYGLHSRDVVYRALRELVERQLIICTREGWRSKSHFALYAVSWLPITHRDGQPLDTPEPAPDGHLMWQPNARKKMNLPSVSRTQSRPPHGHDDSISRPSHGFSEPTCRPSDGNTLRVLVPNQRATRVAEGATPVSLPAVRRSEVRKVRHPTKTARAIDENSDEVRHRRLTAAQLVAKAQS